jgi:hypothetical protein
VLAQDVCGNTLAMLEIMVISASPWGRVVATGHIPVSPGFVAATTLGLVIRATIFWRVRPELRFA